ncbi:MAG: translation initiation factor IF-2 subunit gamma [Promethearchaeota archaeon]
MASLEEISGIGKKTAQILKKAGINTIEDLASASIETLLKIKGIRESTAQKYIENAKNYLKQIENEQGEMVKPKEKVKTKKKEKKEKRKTNIKELMKSQAECNIGLVGHVDHGKTTLVKALTGDWTDRHSEEQERGISIKLGYSNTTILYCPACDLYLTDYMAEQKREKGQPRFTCPNCKGKLEFKRNISFVDAPGHEILMATMLSGASLMDGACLLIAADEDCPQPQTREHLAALEIAKIDKIIIIQNKIDAVSREQALRNRDQIKKFVKGTIAENAPIIPVSAVFGANMELVVKAFEEIIPTPKLDENEDFQFLVARSFDINKPGTSIEDLRGGVIGGSVLKGTISVGEEIEIRPGLRLKDGYQPIRTIVTSISQGRNLLEKAKPGGLIGIGTKLDPSLTKGDSLSGNIAGKIGALPEIKDKVKLKITLFDKVIGSELQLKVHPLKHNERLLIVVGTEKTGGVVSRILKDSYEIKLNPPICPPKGFIYAISRVINQRYRLIGYGMEVDEAS